MTTVPVDRDKQLMSDQLASHAQQVQREEATWREMYLTQPPYKALILHFISGCNRGVFGTNIVGYEIEIHNKERNHAWRDLGKVRKFCRMGQVFARLHLHTLSTI